MVFVDRALSERLERSEGKSNASFVEARAEVSPEVGACWVEVAGALAMFDGPGSPLTQTFALGLREEAGVPVIEELEQFFEVRGAPVFHEVSPMADPSLMALLTSRGYRPVELTSVLFRELDPQSVGERHTGDVHVRTIAPGEDEMWARTAAEGWSEYEGLEQFMLELGRVSAARPDGRMFLAEIDGTPVATASLSIHDGVALLAGASTIPRARGRGAQLALLHSRLEFAVRRGCDVAMMGAAPGSGSQRNAEREGFRLAYTRIKWAMGD